MGKLLELYAWLQANYIPMLSSLAILLVGLEGLVRLTPTKKDDSALERVGKWLQWLMDLLKIPNVKRSDEKLVDGQHPPLAEAEKK